MRILFITNTPPISSQGGAMIFYRHFCERKDFTISVITNDTQINNYKVLYNYLLIDHSKAWKRLSHTRFYLMAHTWDKLVGYRPNPKNVLDFAADFKPGAIFTIAGSWGGMALLAQDVAKKLKVPLIAGFYDWWNYNAFYYPSYAAKIEARFRRFYQECDLPICISEGMEKELGKHRNSVVLYPMSVVVKNEPVAPQPANPVFTVAFGGSLSDWYGKMMESIVTVATDKKADIAFKIFGGNPSWSSEFDTKVKEAGIYKGLIPFEQLQKEMQRVDALLLLMGFGEDSAIVESTSFKTKFLDYLTFKKPIILWGPTYCTAVIIANEFNSAEICTSEDANDFLDTIMKVKADKQLQQELVKNGNIMYQDRFHPDKLHEKLVDSIRALLKNTQD